MSTVLLVTQTNFFLVKWHPRLINIDRYREEKPTYLEKQFHRIYFASFLWNTDERETERCVYIIGPFGKSISGHFNHFEWSEMANSKNDE